MRTLFKDKTSKIGSLTILILLTAMLAIFSLALPELLFSTTGRIFAAIWSLMAIVVFIAHATAISVDRRHYVPGWQAHRAIHNRQDKKVKRVMVRG